METQQKSNTKYKTDVFLHILWIFEEISLRIVNITGLPTLFVIYPLCYFFITFIFFAHDPKL